MAALLGISSKTLLRLRARLDSPFREQTHYRHGGISRRAPLQWHRHETDRAFTHWHRPPAENIEAFSGEAALPDGGTIRGSSIKEVRSLISAQLAAPASREGGQ